MIPIASGVRVWLATGVTDMRRGMNTLALQVQEGLGRDPQPPVQGMGAGERAANPGTIRVTTTPGVSSRSRRRRDSGMQNAKATAWGAGLMGLAGLAGALLGPSPLLLPLAPLVAIAYVPFMLVSAALGAGAGKLFGALQARRRKR